MLLDRLAALDAPHAIAAGDLNDRPGGRTLPPPRRRAPGLLGGRALGRRVHLDARRPASADRRDLRHDGRRGPRLRRAARATRASPETDLRAATDHLPVLAALRVPRVA